MNNQLNGKEKKYQNYLSQAQKSQKDKKEPEVLRQKCISGLIYSTPDVKQMIGDIGDPDRNGENYGNRKGYFLVQHLTGKSISTYSTQNYIKAEEVKLLINAA